MTASPEGDSPYGCLCGSSNGGDQRIFSTRPSDMNVAGESVTVHWEGFSFSDSMLMISLRKMGGVSYVYPLCNIEQPTSLRSQQRGVEHA